MFGRDYEAPRTRPANAAPAVAAVLAANDRRLIRLAETMKNPFPIAGSIEMRIMDIVYDFQLPSPAFLNSRLARLAPELALNFNGWR